MMIMMELLVDIEFDVVEFALGFNKRTHNNI